MSTSSPSDKKIVRIKVRVKSEKLADGSVQYYDAKGNIYDKAGNKIGNKNQPSPDSKKLAETRIQSSDKTLPGKKDVPAPALPAPEPVQETSAPFSKKWLAVCGVCAAIFCCVVVAIFMMAKSNNETPVSNTTQNTQTNTKNPSSDFNSNGLELDYQIDRTVHPPTLEVKITSKINNFKEEFVVILKDSNGKNSKRIGTVKKGDLIINGTYRCLSETPVDLGYFLTLESCITEKPVCGKKITAE